jgi:hypothetical protein
VVLKILQNIADLTLERFFGIECNGGAPKAWPQTRKKFSTQPVGLSIVACVSGCGTG